MFKSFAPTELEIVRRALYRLERQYDEEKRYAEGDKVYDTSVKVMIALKSYEDDSRALEMLDRACDFWKQEAIDRGYEE